MHQKHAPDPGCVKTRAKREAIERICRLTAFRQVRVPFSTAATGMAELPLRQILVRVIAAGCIDIMRSRIDRSLLRTAYGKISFYGRKLVRGFDTAKTTFGHFALQKN